MKEKMKWIYTFFLLLAMIGWATFTVITVGNAVASPTSVNVLEASGTSVLLGALIAWNGNVNKHWFGGEKKPPEEKPPEEKPSGG